jgi:hypothetical protein
LELAVIGSSIRPRHKSDKVISKITTGPVSDLLNTALSAESPRQSATPA